MSLRVANCSGFFGDRLSAAGEMVDGGPIDVLTGDYLAELTMALLWRAKRKDPETGYAGTFLTQMEQVLATCLERGIKIVSNAGGLNPTGLAQRLQTMAARARIAVVDGDDLLARLPDLRASGVQLRHLDTGELVGGTPVTANAYLGCWGISRALDLGADVVVTGRVTDAALVMGPAAHHFGWECDDWDHLASVLVAGHIIECGAQATGGNYSFFQKVPGLDHVGFPLVEIDRDGTFVVTKHPGTGGLVSIGTVTAQLLYEIGGARYHSPDVTARFDSVRLVGDGPDRVRVVGVKGEPPPTTTKVAINSFGGHRNSITFVLTGLDIEEKARLVSAAFWNSLGGRDAFADTYERLIRSDHPDPDSNEAAMAHLTMTAKDADPDKVGKRFSRAGVELVLSHYPGLILTAPPSDSTAYAVYSPVAVPSELVEHRVRIGSITEMIPPILAPGFEATVEPTPLPPFAEGETTTVALGRIAGARSGDKGGNANLGVWVEDPTAFGWLAHFLTTERLRSLLPDVAEHAIERHVFANLCAINFVIGGLLGEGVSSSTRTDPQGKTLGEYLRAKLVQAPPRLIDPSTITGR